MRTPILNVKPRSTWREDVAAVWEHLEEKCHVEVDHRCGTHVHISLESGFTLTDIQRLASSVIHFEPAFEALMPLSRKGNRTCKTNWLYSTSLAIDGSSRRDAICKISNAPGIDEVIAMIQSHRDKCFAWNFQSLNRMNKVEFRQPPGSKSAGEVLGWAELAMNFVQASIAHGTPEKLDTIPSNIKGLRWYLHQVCVAGVNESHRMDWIWREKDEGEIPYIEVKSLTHWMTETILAEKDTEDMRKHAKSHQIPDILRSGSSESLPLSSREPSLDALMAHAVSRLMG
jgi:Putative amidoligase enzyme